MARGLEFRGLVPCMRVRGSFRDGSGHLVERTFGDLSPLNQ